MEKIGLQAVLETDDWKKGVKEYQTGEATLEKANQNMADDVARLGGDFRELEGAVQDAAAQFRAATPENVKFAEAYGKITDAFDKGEISAQEAANQLDHLNDEIKQSKKTSQETSPFMEGFSRKIEDIGKKFGLSSEQCAAFIQSMSKIVTAAAPFILVGGAVMVAAKAFEQLQKFVQPTVDRAKEVRDLARAMGSTAEEASKLKEAADDVGISFDTLKTAVIGAVKKGFDPSIDSIANMADEYGRLNPGLEQTKYLMEHFGRSGPDIAALMEKGGTEIRRMGEEAETMGIVLDTKAVMAARDYEIAVDNMNDSIMAVRQELAQALIPVLTTVADVMTEFFNQQEVYKTAIQEGWMPQMSGTAQSLVIPMQEAQKAIEDAAFAAQLSADGGDPYLQFLDAIKVGADEDTTAINGVAVAMIEMSKAAIGAAEAQALGEAYAAGRISLTDYRAALIDVNSTMLGIPEAQTLASINTQMLTDNFAAGKITLDEYQRGMRDMGHTADSVATKQEALTDITNVYREAIAADGVAQDDLVLSMRDASIAVYEQKDALQNQTYALDMMRLGIEVAKPGMEGFQDTLLGTGEYATDAAVGIMNAKNATDLLYNKGVTVTVDFRATGDTWIAGELGGGGSRSTTIGTDDTGGGHRAFGGPVTAGSPYSVAEMRPEVFVPATNGYIYPSSQSFEGGIASAVASALRGVMAQMGNQNQYNLNVNSMQSTGSIVSDFEIMRLMS